MAIRPQLTTWQWSNYETFHRHRGNLLLHIVTVPMFWAGLVGLVTSLVRLRPLDALGSFVFMLLPLVIQGVGHKREGNPPIPFLGPLDLLSRFFVEQMVTFPRFLLTGGWRKNLGGRPAESSFPRGNGP
jgi:hypothetical protein